MSVVGSDVDGSCVVGNFFSDSERLNVSGPSVDGAKDTDPDKVGVSVSTEASGPMSQQAWGIPLETEEFIREAVKAGHPKAFRLLLPKGLDKAILENFSTEVQGDLIAMRAQWFKRWLHEAHVLEKDETKLKSHMPEHMRLVLKHKRLLVWKAILVDLQYTDLGVCDELFKGVQLVGGIPVTGIFDPCFKAAELTVEQLQGLGAQERLAAFYSSRTSGDDSVDKEVMSKTMDEVSNHWARGPFSLDELPENIVISRRFGLKQTSKTRLIDDLSGSKINAAVQAAESPKPQGTDIIAAICLSMLQSKGEQSIKGRTFDMKSAYKQMPLAPDALWASFVAVFDPILRKPQAFQLLVAPFGATRSVYSFLRAAYSIWHIGVWGLRLIWS